MTKKMTLLTTTVMAEQELCSKAFIRCIQGAGSSNHTLVHTVANCNNCTENVKCKMQGGTARYLL